MHIARLHALRRDGPTLYAFDWSLADAETTRLKEGLTLVTPNGATVVD